MVSMRVTDQQSGQHGSQQKQDSTHTMGIWSHQVSIYHLSKSAEARLHPHYGHMVTPSQHASIISATTTAMSPHFGAKKFDTWILALTILTTTSPHNGQMPSNEPTLWASAISVQHSWCPSCYARAHIHNMAHTLGNMILSECLPSSVSLLFPIMSSKYRSHLCLFCICRNAYIHIYIYPESDCLHLSDIPPDCLHLSHLPPCLHLSHLPPMSVALRQVLRQVLFKTTKPAAIWS